MGVDVDAQFEYGYKVSCEDIPDFDARMDNEFSDLADEPDGWKVTICGTEVWCSDLVTGDSAYEGYDGQDWYISVGLPSEATPDEVIRKCRESDELVRKMYELVMRRPPTDDPKIHVYARWC